MKIFFWYCLNIAVGKFRDSSSGTVNAIQKKFAYLNQMGKQIKSSLLIKTLL